MLDSLPVDLDAHLSELVQRNLGLLHADIDHETIRPSVFFGLRRLGARIGPHITTISSAILG